MRTLYYIVLFGSLIVVAASSRSTQAVTWGFDNGSLEGWRGVNWRVDNGTLHPVLDGSNSQAFLESPLFRFVNVPASVSLGSFSGESNGQKLVDMGTGTGEEEAYEFRVINLHFTQSGQGDELIASLYRWTPPTSGNINLLDMTFGNYSAPYVQPVDREAVDPAALYYARFSAYDFDGNYNNPMGLDSVTISGAELVGSIVGDFNRNKVVDAADYVVWRDRLGQSVERCSDRDTNCNGFVDNSDYQPWRTHFADKLPETAASRAHRTWNIEMNVPEPRSSLIAAWSLSALAALRIGRRAAR